MSVLIKGIQMPENGETETITICDDGIVFEERKEPWSVFKATPVPDNLRLMWIAEDKWLKREPPMLKFWAWLRWKRERPVWEEVSE